MLWVMKPGIYTTEFWIVLLSTVAGAIAGSGLLVPGSMAAQIVGIAAATLGAIVYVIMRTQAKTAVTSAAVGALGENSNPVDVATVLQALHLPAPVAAPAAKTGSVILNLLASLAAVVALAALAIAFCSCGPKTKAVAKNGVSDIVDCTTPDRLKLEAQFGPTVEQMIARATGDDGKVDLPSLDAATKALEADGWCVLEKTVSRLLAAVFAPGAPHSSPLESSDLRAKVDQLRARKFGATRFDVSTGP